MTGKPVVYTWDGTNAAGVVVPDGTLPDHDLDRRRLEQPGVDQQGRHGRPASRRAWPSAASDLHLAQRRRPIRSHDPQAGRADAPVDRHGPDPRHERRDVRRWTFASDRVGCLDLGWPRRRRADRRRRPLHVPVWGLDRAGNPTIRDLPVRVDRTIRSLTWARSSFTPAAGQKDAPVVRARPAGHGHGLDLPGRHPGPGHLDGSPAGRRQLRLDLERPDDGGALREGRDLPGRRHGRSAGSARRPAPGPSSSRRRSAAGASRLRVR